MSTHGTYTIERRNREGESFAERQRLHHKARCLQDNANSIRKANWGEICLPGESKKFTRLVGCVTKSVQPIFTIFKIEMLIFRLKANLDERILFGKIIHHLGLESWQRVHLGTRIPHSILVHDLLAIEIRILFLKLAM